MNRHGPSRTRCYSVTKLLWPFRPGSVGLNRLQLPSFCLLNCKRAVNVKSFTSLPLPPRRQTGHKICPCLRKPAGWFRQIPCWRRHIGAARASACHVTRLGTAREPRAPQPARSPWSRSCRWGDPGWRWSDPDLDPGFDLEPGSGWPWLAPGRSRWPPGFALGGGAGWGSRGHGGPWGRRTCRWCRPGWSGCSGGWRRGSPGFARLCTAGFPPRSCRTGWTCTQWLVRAYRARRGWFGYCAWLKRGWLGYCARLVTVPGVADLVTVQGVADLVTVQCVADLVTVQGVADLVTVQGWLLCKA